MKLWHWLIVGFGVIVIVRWRNAVNMQNVRLAGLKAATTGNQYYLNYNPVLGKDVICPPGTGYCYSVRDNPGVKV